MPTPTTNPDEKGLGLTFMEELMERAHASNTAGLSPGPRSFHGLIVSQSLVDVESAVQPMQMQSLRRDSSAGLQPPPHKMLIKLVRLFGAKGRSAKGLEIFAAMKDLNFDICRAWIAVVGCSI